MTDSDVIKILEYCATGAWCSECPYEKKCLEEEITQLALDLINRQREEIDNKDDLIHRQSDVISEQKEKIERIYAEAVKEFADLSIKRICENVTPIPQQKYLVNMCIQEIENTQKEVVGDNYE